MPGRINLKAISDFLPYYALITLFYLPVIIIIAKAFLRRGAMVELLNFLKSSVFLNTLIFSCQEAFLSSLGSLLLALPGAYFFGKYEFPGKRYLRSFLILPFMLPGILVVLSMVIFYGQNGVFNQLLALFFPGGEVKFTGLYGFWGIILSHIFYNFSFCLRLLGESWERIDPKLPEASATLGASKVETFCRVTLPLLLPTLVYLFILVFLYSFLSFTVVLVLGGFIYKTFEVLIYIEYNSKLHFDRAALIAGVQMLLLGGFLYLQSFVGRKIQRQAVFCRTLPRLTWGKNPPVVTVALCYISLMAFFFLTPLVSVLVRSFRERALPEGGFTFHNYQQLFSEGFRFAVGERFSVVLWHSLPLSVLVAILAVGLAYYLVRLGRDRAWGKKDLWLQLPLGVSFLTFAFGLFLLSSRRLPTWLLLIWAQLFLAFPMVYSILRTARRELGEDLLEAAAALGASPSTTAWTVELPMMKKPLQTAFAYAMALSLGDLSAVLVLGQGEVITLPVAIYRLIGHYRFAQATALGAIFLLLSFLVFLLIEGYYQRPSRVGREQLDQEILSDADGGDDCA
jgi:thiamine transport system permease protein